MRKITRLAIVSLFTTFIACNMHNSKPPTDHKPADKNWLGSWERTEWQNNAELTVKSIHGDSVEFTLSAASGGNAGELEGIAVADGNKATFLEVSGDDSCIMTFELLGDTAVDIDQVKGICGAGLGVQYSGHYSNSKINAGSPEPDTKSQTLTSIGLLDSADDALVRSLTGDEYDQFVTSTQLTSNDSDLDGHNAQVYSSGVRGLFTEMENIVMISPDKKLWAAVIDSDRVFYYTNDKSSAGKLPKTIEAWRERFKQYPVVYKSVN